MTATLRLAYGSLWAATIAGLLLGLVGLTIVTVPTPHDALPATAATAISLAVHNLPVVLWPIALAAIGWHQHHGTRIAGDVLTVGQLLAHGLLVGGALAQHAELWRYLPHLPVEWLAIAIGPAAWFSVRSPTQMAPYRRLSRCALAAAAATVTAAALETWTVPL